MPFPLFDHNDVLPPTMGDVTQQANMSPYRVGILEVVQRFGSSAPRVAILLGLLDLRDDLRRCGVDGFQWLDGSFVEDVEKVRGRPPADLDLVTFFHPPPFAPDPTLLAVLRDHKATKIRYLADHYLIPLRDKPERLVDSTRYWFGLFSHQKSTAVWKGLLQLDLATPNDDLAARQHLTTLSFP